MRYLIFAAILLLIAASETLAFAHVPGMMSGMSGRGMQSCMQIVQGTSGEGTQLPSGLNDTKDSHDTSCVPWSGDAKRC
jgi:hypothetical protein